MTNRDFLRKSASAAAASALLRLSAAQAPVTSSIAARTNWAGNYTYKATGLDQPENAVAVQKLLSSLDHAKALGARHSFNDIADSSGHQISLRHLDDMTLNSAARTVTVGAGVTFGKLSPWIDAQGFAVHNLASLPHVSVAGACATATHGSGNRNGNLSTAVSAIEFVDGRGQLQTIARSQTPDDFQGAVVALGALGIITRITLDVIPTFQVSQVVYENLPFEQLEHNLEAIFSSGYSVSLFTDWQNHRATQVWLKQTVSSATTPELPENFYGATLQKVKLHPLAGHSPENCTEQLGAPGPWFERLPHFKMNFIPSSGAEVQSEFFVPRDRAYQAILAVEQLRNHIRPHLFISELRTIAADDLWLSPAYQRGSLAIHFTWKPEMNAVLGVLPLIEKQLATFNARPHWAKVYTTSGQRLNELYTRLPDFRRLISTYDPAGKFTNPYLRRTIEA